MASIRGWMPELTLTGMRVVYEVGTRGSFTGAARALGYTQSGISRQVGLAEQALGVELFERLSRGVRPTARGEVLIGRRSIHFKHARPKAMAGLEGKFALVVQALRHIGKQGIGPSEIEKLRSSLSPAEKRRLVKDARFGVDWIYEVAKKIAEKTA